MYDFENHLIQAGGVTWTYDGDGNRAQKVTGGVTTQYTVDSRNPTGYTQVLAESRSTVGRSTTFKGWSCWGETLGLARPNPTWSTDCSFFR